MGVSLCSLGSLIFLGPRPVRVLDACCLFPQHMLAIIPLIGWVPGEVRALTGAQSWDPNGISSPHPPLETEMEAVACTYPWNSCGWCPVAWQHTLMEKEAPKATPPPSSWASQKWCLASFRPRLLPFFPYFLGCGEPHPCPLRQLIYVHSPSWLLKPKSQQLALAHPNIWASQAGESDSNDNHLCRSRSNWPSRNQGLCSPLRLQSSCSVLADPLANDGTSPGAHVPSPLLSLSFFFFFALSYPDIKRFSCPFWTLRSSSRDQ